MLELLSYEAKFSKRSGNRACNSIWLPRIKQKEYKCKDQ